MCTEAGSSFGELALLYFAPRAVAHLGASGWLYSVSCCVLLSCKIREMEILWYVQWKINGWGTKMEEVWVQCRTRIFAQLAKATITATADAVVWVTARQQFKDLLMKVARCLVRRLAPCEVPKLVIQVRSALDPFQANENEMKENLKHVQILALRSFFEKKRYLFVAKQVVAVLGNFFAGQTLRPLWRLALCLDEVSRCDCFAPLKDRSDELKWIEEHSNPIEYENTKSS